MDALLPNWQIVLIAKYRYFLTDGTPKEKWSAKSTLCVLHGHFHGH